MFNVRIYTSLIRPVFEAGQGLRNHHLSKTFEGISWKLMRVMCETHPKETELIILIISNYCVLQSPASTGWYRGYQFICVYICIKIQFVFPVSLNAGKKSIAERSIAGLMHFLSDILCIRSVVLIALSQR